MALIPLGGLCLPSRTKWIRGLLTNKQHVRIIRLRLSAQPTVDGEVTFGFQINKIKAASVEKCHQQSGWRYVGLGGKGYTSRSTYIRKQKSFGWFFQCHSSRVVRITVGMTQRSAIQQSQYRLRIARSIYRFDISRFGFAGIPTWNQLISLFYSSYSAQLAPYQLFTY